MRIDLATRPVLYPATIHLTPDTTTYRDAIGHFATGVTVVTSSGPSGLTANAVCSLSLEPLLMLVCLDTGSRTLESIRRSRRLAVNVLARHQEEIAQTFASKAPEAEKFAGIPYEEVSDLPVLGGVVAWLTGRLRELIPGGDHVIALAEVERVGAPGGDPLVHFRGGYRFLSEDA